ncbi:MAG: DUF86 domain-containing protein [Candidatus Hydrogenedentes bacterium]|nr:DUF86 domain-containing protein [Candidatus Hydrogenedentota bacterium]
MKDEARALLFDMQQACERILQFTKNKTLAGYGNDVYCRSAVERQFQIAGEALVKLSKLHPDVAEQIPSRRTIISFRNILVHGYDKVDNEVVWGVITRDLPTLCKILEDLLA